MKLEERERGPEEEETEQKERLVREASWRNEEGQSNHSCLHRSPFLSLSLSSFLCSASRLVVGWRSRKTSNAPMRIFRGFGVLKSGKRSALGKKNGVVSTLASRYIAVYLYLRD